MAGLRRNLLRITACLVVAAPAHAAFAQVSEQDRLERCNNNRTMVIDLQQSIDKARKYVLTKAELDVAEKKLASLNAGKARIGQLRARFNRKEMSEDEYYRLEASELDTTGRAAREGLDDVLTLEVEITAATQKVALALASAESIDLLQQKMSYYKNRLAELRCGDAAPSPPTLQFANPLPPPQLQFANPLPPPTLQFANPLTPPASGSQNPQGQSPFGAGGWEGTWTSAAPPATYHFSGNGAGVSAIFESVFSDVHRSGAYTGCTPRGDGIDCSYQYNHQDAGKSGQVYGVDHLVLAGCTIYVKGHINFVNLISLDGKPATSASMFPGAESINTYKKQGCTERP